MSLSQLDRNVSVIASCHGKHRFHRLLNLSARLPKGEQHLTSFRFRDANLMITYDSLNQPHLNRQGLEWLIEWEEELLYCDECVDENIEVK